jgi:[ribosomal protein S5]-alanine N-acetyltransferase
VSCARTCFLKTERLCISHWDRNDLALATSLWGDANVSAMIGGSFSQAAIKARLEREIATLRDYRLQYWPLFLLEDGAFAGCAGLRPHPGEPELLELGFHLRPLYWGQGFAPEAARAVIVYAFETLRVKGLFAGHHPANAASRRVITKLGFRFTHEEFYAPTGLIEPCYLLLNPHFS